MDSSQSFTDIDPDALSFAESSPEVIEYATNAVASASLPLAPSPPVHDYVLLSQTVESLSSHVSDITQAFEDLKSTYVSELSAAKIRISKLATALENEAKSREEDRHSFNQRIAALESLQLPPRQPTKRMRLDPADSEGGTSMGHTNEPASLSSNSTDAVASPAALPSGSYAAVVAAAPEVSNPRTSTVTPVPIVGTPIDDDPMETHSLIRLLRFSRVFRLMISPQRKREGESAAKRISCHL